jgi:ABC-type polysaccharide/polyol phosphate transport system ATPase subunit
VTTLLTVGLGFNVELTGRENIQLGGLANGFTNKQILAKEHEIAEFSGLGEFIDYPMKTYSSGMRSRLGFAVVTHMEPEILLIDEALSAGDAAFREQASAKIKELMGKAKAIVLVSHGLATVEEMASHCLWLDHGKVMGYGEPAEMIRQYKAHVNVVGTSAIVNEEQ